MSIRVIKSTELDGVTLKDADTGSVLAETGVSKRVGLVLDSHVAIEDLKFGDRMVFVDYEDFVPSHRTYTTMISDIDVTEDGLTAVTTRNTIYFLKDEG